jgi:hypothetical protein
MGNQNIITLQELEDDIQKEQLDHFARHIKQFIIQDDDSGCFFFLFHFLSFGS